MNDHELANIAALRSVIRRGERPQAAFRQALIAIPPERRDAWFDALLELDEIPEDGAALPRGCVPYLPCPVDALRRLLDAAQVTDADVFVDIGSGIGRATVLAHLLSGANSIGIEVQPQLAHAHRALAAHLGLSCPAIIGDAAELSEPLALGSVFFLYCPFSGARLASLLETLRQIALIRPIRIGCLDLVLPPCAWLRERPLPLGDLRLYSSAGAE